MSDLKPVDFAIKNLNIYPSLGYTRLFTAYSSWNGDHVVEATLFFYVVEGELVLTIEDNNYIVRPGQLALLPHRRRHTYVLPSGKNLSFWRISFRTEVDGEDFFEKYGLAEDNHVVNIDDHEELVRLFEEASFSKKFDDELSLRVNCVAKTADIIAIYVRERMKHMLSNSLEFEEVIDFMKENLGNKLTLKQLADMMHMEPTYFSRKFKKKVGVSPLKYYDELRIKKAINLLLNTDLSINKVGKSIGVDSSLYFSQFFKKNVGVSPLEYKKLFGKDKA